MRTKPRASVVFALLSSLLAAGAGRALAAEAEVVQMPDGKPFAFWEDETRYTNVYHVACEHPEASDANPGTEAQPFATINRAATQLQPGEKVVVHTGVYRECVRPARGGEGPDRMIAYEVAPGADVHVKGSEILPADAVRRSEGWSRAGMTSPVVWMADLPPAWFAATAYNPFIANNMTAEYTTFTKDWTPEETRRQQLRRGMVFGDGVRLQQVFRFGEVVASNGTFWVEEPGTRIHFRLPGDGAPSEALIEVTAREQVFAPTVRGLGYIRVQGFTLEHAADGVPIPQRALLSTYRGHNWIIADNTVRWANGCGIDIGRESWHAWSAAAPAARGRHIVRRNRISHCGICGVAGMGQLDGSLIEDNIVEHIGWQDVERMWETGGMKFHTCDGVLIRDNVFRHIRHAPGLWLDYRNRNTRVTGNLFHDIAARNGAIYLEVSQGPNVVDHNVFSGIRADRPASEKAHALNVDTGEKCTAAHNLFMDIPDGFAVAMHLGQAGREVEGRNGLCRKHAVLNNVFVRCAKRVLLERSEDNRCDGNLYDRTGNALSFRIEYPSPRSILDFDAWQEYFGYDLAGRQAVTRASLDPETLQLTLEIDGELPVCEAVPVLGAAPTPVQPGPFALAPLPDGQGPVVRVERTLGPKR